MREGTKRNRRNVWTQTKILSPNTRYFVAILRFVAIYALLEIFGQKMCLFGSKTVFLGQEGHYYMVYITELSLQICDYAQKRRICRENFKHALDKKFSWPFLPPTKGCQVLPPCTQVTFSAKFWGSRLEPVGVFGSNVPLALLIDP